ncbi:TPA: hypothetical protein DDW35_09880 [Candidatus Sumerlaeota bacterium]|jgi:hypothetical protein|nr:hypothetical protein [Candidatus Sumerlaeota bacterium]
MRYELSNIHAVCPVCGSNSVLRLWKTNSDKAAQHFVLRNLDPERHSALATHIKNLWGTDSCEAAKCNNCHFVFSHPYIGGDHHFYTLAYEREGYPTWTWEFQKTFDVIKNMGSPDLRLIEIGAGNGSFLRRAVQLIKSDNITAMEFSDYGCREISKLGINYYQKDIKEFIPTSPVDIIAMFQVLEHMDQLSATFNHLYALLKSGGSLFIAVPRAERITFNEQHGALLDMPPNHIGRWNKKAFEIVAEKYGFDLVQYQQETPKFWSGFKQLTSYRVLRKSQINGTLENLALSVKNKRIRSVLYRGLFALYSPFAIFPVLKMVRAGLGNSQWVQMVKK